MALYDKYSDKGMQVAEGMNLLLAGAAVLMRVRDYAEVLSGAGTKARALEGADAGFGLPVTPLVDAQVPPVAIPNTETAGYKFWEALQTVCGSFSTNLPKSFTAKLDLKKLPL